MDIGKMLCAIGRVKMRDVTVVDDAVAYAGASLSTRVSAANKPAWATHGTEKPWAHYDSIPLTEEMMREGRRFARAEPDNEIFGRCAAKESKPSD